MSGDDRRQREVFYTGRVQGVGFRYTVRALALRFDVTGFVRNLPDGRVHLTVEGTDEELAAFLNAVQAEMGHYISETQETTRPATGRFAAFIIAH